MIPNSAKTVSLLIITFVITACGTPPAAPVDGRQAPPSQKINYHIVSRGETLFSIAWRYEKEVDKLAALNNLSSAYTIYPGQRLLLDTSGVSTADISKARSTPKSKPTTSVKRNPQNTSRVEAKPPSAQPNRSPSALTAAKPAPVKAAPKPVANIPSSKLVWQWPVKGKVVKSYNASQLFKGIDINGLPGGAVRPAAPGTVLYAGDGLRGYGNLIIIRHNNVFISAYAHNRRIFVKEGARVKAGQKIAEVGGDPANVRRFYFEIRKDGKPVNPLRYLPRR